MTLADLLPPREQLEQYAVTIADATGAATFSFPNVPQSLAWVGNVTVLGAPSSSLFVGKVGNTPWGVWSGPLPFGPILAGSGMQLVVTATGLQPGVQYSACWLGVSDLASTLGPVMPAPSSASASALPVAPIISEFNHTGFSYTSPVFQVSNVRGARFVCQNNGATSIVLQLQWRPTSGSITTAQGLVNGLPVFSTGGTFRNIVISPSGAANFTHPHLGDFLTVTVVGVTGGALNFNLVVASTASDRTVWSGILHSNIPDLIYSFNSTVPATVSTNLGLSVDIYAGPATLTIAGVATAVMTVSVQAMGVDGTFNNIARGFQTTDSPLGFSLPLTLPPAPIQVIYNNGDAAVRSITCTITADSWQS